MSVLLSVENAFKSYGALRVTDNLSFEVRPNEAKEANQPWRWVAIPAIGVLKGEIFYLKELADDCVSEFFFTAPPSPPPGGAGSPINPQAIR